MSNSEVFVLSKKVEKIFEEAKVTPPVMRVGWAVDYTGSADHLYRKGKIQTWLAALFPVAVKLDDDQLMNCVAFGGSIRELPDVSVDNWKDYVRIYVQRGSYETTTLYAPSVAYFTNLYFPSAADRMVNKAKGLLAKFGLGNSGPVVIDNGTPALVFLVTDGQNYDQSEFLFALSQTVEKPIFWVLIGIGKDNFNNPIAAAKKFPNVSFHQFDEEQLSPEEIYQQLLDSKLMNWLGK